MAATPTIDLLEWGRVHTAVGTFRDACLWPGGGRSWDWTVTGTHHQPGVRATDLDAVLAHPVDIVVIGGGQQQRLGVTDEARSAVADVGAKLEDQETNGVKPWSPERLDLELAQPGLLDDGQTCTWLVRDSSNVSYDGPVPSSVLASHCPGVMHCLAGDVVSQAIVVRQELGRHRVDRGLIAEAAHRDL